MVVGGLDFSINDLLSIKDNGAMIHKTPQSHRFSALLQYDLGCQGGNVIEKLLSIPRVESPVGQDHEKPKKDRS